MGVSCARLTAVLLLCKTHSEAVAVLRAAADPISLRVLPARAVVKGGSKNEASSPSPVPPKDDADASTLSRKPSRVAPPPPMGIPLRPRSTRNSKVPIRAFVCAHPSARRR